MSDDLKDLKTRIDYLRKATSDLMPGIRKDIDYIKKNHVTSEKEIETLLDTILNFIELGYGEKEFKDLNKYYSTINKEHAEDYTEIYNEDYT